jgi:hypothetical protein
MDRAMTNKPLSETLASIFDWRGWKPAEILNQNRTNVLRALSFWESANSIEPAKPANDALTAAYDKLALLRAALEPFVKPIADKLAVADLDREQLHGFEDGDMIDHDLHDFFALTTYGDLRRARSALEETK